MKSILPYLKAYRVESVLSPLFKMLEALMELFVPLVMARIMDEGIALGDTALITRMGLLLVALGALGLAFSITAQYFAAKAAVGFATKLRHEVFGHLGRLSYSDLDTLGAPTMVTRMTSDINQVQTGVNMALRLFLRSPFVVFGAMIMAFSIDVQAALIFVGTIVLLFAAVVGIMRITAPKYRKVQGLLDRVLAATRENLTGVRVLRAFNMQEEETGRFVKENGGLTAAQLKVGRISALMNPLTYVIINLATIAVLQAGGVRVSVGALTQGQVVALVNYMSQILVELVKLANLVVTISRGLASANRVSSVLALPCEDRSGAPLPADPAGAPAVEFCAAGMKYQGAGGEAVSGVTLTVPHGATVGVIGGTGSGKSSLVNLIPGFYPCSSGQVKVDGVDVAGCDKALLRARVAVVPQKAVLFHGTVRSNLLWGNPNATDGELWAALETAQAKDFIEKKEGGLDCEVEQGGRNFSGGQRQRLTIARALVKKPEILILDDSASALDLATDARLRKAIAAMEGETTVFIVSQRAAAVRGADAIVVLDDGHVAGIGTHEELLGTCKEYQEIYYSQFEREEGRA